MTDPLNILATAQDYVPPVDNDKVQQKVFSHADLMATQFQPTKWIVEKLIPASGLTVLGGKKKLGKSWLSLQIAQGVAGGKPVLSYVTCQGNVIYMALEDGIKRLRVRLEKQHAPGMLPITYITECVPLNYKGGKEAFEALLTEHKPILLIIDTFAAAKSGKVDENEAGGMADLTNYLRRKAQEFECAILLVLHHGKATHGNAGDDIRGSSAIAGAADLNIGLYKDESGFKLAGEGRDIEEFELKIEFDAVDTWKWQLVGDARQIAREQAENEIIEALEGLVKADAGAIAKEVGKARQTVNTTLKRMRKDGKLHFESVETSGGNKFTYSLKG